MGQFGDTTYTKVFVGGLAWETHQEAMRRYFEQFGEILEAVVIADKHTGRSKGYGFVTFREPDAAMRACVDPAPVIDGRRANCNLAFLGVQRSGPATPKHGVVGRSFRVVKPTFGRQQQQQHQAVGIQGGGPVATPFPSPAATFPHYAFPYSTVYGYGYGYSPYSADYSYPTNYYNVYGGAHYPSAYGGAASGMLTATSEAPLYPYFQLGQPGSSMTSYATGQGYSLQYPQMFHFSTVPSTAAAGTSVAPQYGGPVSLAASPRSQAGRTMALTAPTLSAPAQATAHPYGLMPSHFVVSAAPEHPLA